MRVFVRTCISGTISMAAEPEDTLSIVLSQLDSRSIPLTASRLSYHGRPLELAATLQEANIPDSATLDLLPILVGGIFKTNPYTVPWSKWRPNAMNTTALPSWWQAFGVIRLYPYTLGLAFVTMLTWLVHPEWSPLFRHNLDQHTSNLYRPQNSMGEIDFMQNLRLFQLMLSDYRHQLVAVSLSYLFTAAMIKRFESCETNTASWSNQWALRRLRNVALVRPLVVYGSVFFSYVFTKFAVEDFTNQATHMSNWAPLPRYCAALACSATSLWWYGWGVQRAVVLPSFIFVADTINDRLSYHGEARVIGPSSNSRDQADMLDDFRAKKMDRVVITPGMQPYELTYAFPDDAPRHREEYDPILVRGFKIKNRNYIEGVPTALEELKWELGLRDRDPSWIDPLVGAWFPKPIEAGDKGRLWFWQAKTHEEAMNPPSPSELRKTDRLTEVKPNKMIEGAARFLHEAPHVKSEWTTKLLPPRTLAVATAESADESAAALRRSAVARYTPRIVNAGNPDSLSEPRWYGSTAHQ